MLIFSDEELIPKYGFIKVARMNTVVVCEIRDISISSWFYINIYRWVDTEIDTHVFVYMG